MILCRTAAQLAAALAADGRDWTLVPTMGGLHAGHLSLLRQAQAQAGGVLATIFVNRHQFDDPADFSAYPREEEQDLARLREAGVDLAYVPDEDAVWGGEAPRVDEYEMPGLTDVLEGRHRPGHLPAVAAVVDRLFAQTAPAAAVFGEKDYQQLALVRRLAARRRPPVRIIAAPVAREPDGLALSSRNRRLDAGARARAAGLHRTLAEAAAALRDGLAAERVEAQAFAALVGRGFAPDYVAAREAESLRPAAASDRNLVLLAAARLAGVRLLDAVRLELP